ncbi:MAG: VWA domain-containing protein, partial [Bacteroidetes bacterium]
MNGLSGITFAYPEALLLLLLIPLYLYWYLRIYRRERLVIRLSYDPERIQPGNKAMTYLRMLPRGMQLFALGLLILALSRPQAEQKLVDPVANGLDIMLLIDVSASMEARDISPNRLEAAKETAAGFIAGRKYDQIGLVLFAEEALSYAPLTLDYEFLKQLIRSIQPRFFSGQSTAIGTAVSAAINRMRDSNSPGRVIVLLTDGANNGGEIDPVTAAKLAAEHNIRIYTVGIGRNSYFDPVSGQTLE